MKVERNINWFLSEPTRLMQMKPFTRGGTYNLHGYEKNPQGILNNTSLETGFAELTLHPISQDLYITEYRPDLHHIILNKNSAQWTKLPNHRYKFSLKFQSKLYRSDIITISSNLFQTVSIFIQYRLHIISIYIELN